MKESVHYEAAVERLLQGKYGLTDELVATSLIWLVIDMHTRDGMDPTEFMIAEAKKARPHRFVPLAAGADADSSECVICQRGKDNPAHRQPSNREGPMKRKVFVDVNFYADKLKDEQVTAALKGAALRGLRHVPAITAPGARPEPCGSRIQTEPPQDQTSCRQPPSPQTCSRRDPLRRHRGRVLRMTFLTTPVIVFALVALPFIRLWHRWWRGR